MVNFYTGNFKNILTHKILISQLIKKYRCAKNSEGISQNIFFSSRTIGIIGVLLFVIMGIEGVNAATIYSNKTGNWTSTSTWIGGTVPGSGDDVIINGNDVVTVNTTTATCKSLQIGGDNTYNNSGSLTFSTTGNPYLTVINALIVGGYGNTARIGTVTFTNGSTLDAGSVVLGNPNGTPAAGNINMTAGGTLRTGRLTVNTVSGNTWTPGAGTVALDATNTLPTTIFTSFNNLSTISTGTTTTGANLTIGGNLNVGDGTTFTTATTNNLTVTGTTTVGGGTSGNLVINSWGGTIIFNGLLTVNSGGSWSNSAYSLPLTFRGGITNNGTFTAGSVYRYTFDTNAQSLNGNIDFSGSSVIITGINLTNNGTLTLSSNLNGTGSLTNVAMGILNLNNSLYTDITTIVNQGVINYASTNGINTVTANFTNTGIINLNGSGQIAGITNNAGGVVNLNSLAASGATINTFNNATSTSVLNISALTTNTTFIGTLTATTATNTVSYNGTGAQTVKNTTYSNLILSGNGTKSISAVTSISNNLSISTAIAGLAAGINVSAGSLTLGGLNRISGTWGSTTSAATYQDNTYFTATTGIVNVASDARPTPVFSGLTASQSIWAGTPTVTLSGTLSASGPIYPVAGETVGVTINGVLQNAIVTGSVGGFSISYNSASIPAGTYNITYSYSGDTKLKSATNASTTLTVNTPFVTISNSTLTGFNYVYDFGPSALQSFIVNGTGLTNPITITPPVDYEVSKDGGTTYTTTPFTVPNNSATTIYVRLKAGLAVGNYNSENIVLTSGVATQNVSCSGFVSATSTFIVANGGINCAKTIINLYSTASANISNVYWTGPNNFYSTSPNPIINPVTSANSGDYVVTGSVLSGVNLVTNGNFEAGNTGFSTAYLYAGTSSTALSSGGPWGSGEGQYTVVADPHSVHSGYSSSPDHTIGGSTPVGLQMVVNGSQTANVTLWSETASVQPNTNYQFTYWIQSVVSSSPPQLTFKINTVVVGPTFTAITTAGNWTQYIYNWNSGSNSSAVLSLVNLNTSGGGNDFALDDISFQAITQVSALININVASTAPSLVIASASANPVNVGTMVTFTTKPTNGGTAPTYQWYVNGNPVTGATGATYSYVPSNNDKVSCVMTPVGACVSTPVTSNTIMMTVNSVPNYWVGTASSTNWNIPTNWSAGFVPAPGDDVVFASPSNSYGSNALNDLYVDDNHTVGNLVNQTTNRKLVVSPTKNIVVNQQITSASADRIYIKSDPNLPNGSLIFKASQTNPVYATVEMYSKATYDATGVQDPNTSLWYHYSWQYFGVPVASVTADPTFYGSFVRSYDESKPAPYQKWTSLGNSDVLVPFKGYEITQDAPTTIVFQGQLINTDKTITLTNTVATAYDPGQNILSNPYTAAIDIRQLVFDSNTEPTVYLYNTGSFGAWATNTGYAETGYSSAVAPVVPGQYLAIPQSNAGTGTIPYDIPSMSGFLVKVKTNLGSLTIPYSSVITKNVNIQRAPQAQNSTDKKYIEISLHGEHYGDCMWLVEQPGTTRGFDSGWDGYKLSGAIGTPMLFAQEENGNYQISTSDDLNNTYLGFQAGVDLEDTLTFKHENLELKYAGVYLVDLVENKVVDITKSGTQYAFKAETTSAPVKRFKIVTEPYVKNAEDLMTRIKVFNDNNVIYVDNTSSEKGELHVYDPMGRCLKTGIFSANTISTFPLFSNSGIYIVKAVTNTEKVSKQIIVKY